MILLVYKRIEHYFKLSINIDTALLNLPIIIYSLRLHQYEHEPSMLDNDKNILNAVTIVICII